MIPDLLTKEERRNKFIEENPNWTSLNNGLKEPPLKVIKYRIPTKGNVRWKKLVLDDQEWRRNKKLPKEEL